MPRYFLELAYHGGAYRGWQNQPDAPSVQGEVERAMRTVLHAPALIAVGCGRTDTGVHATSYFLHFDADKELDDRFLFSLNSVLPDDIAMKRLIPVANGAHARFDATERGYAYLIHGDKDPFLEGRSYLLKPSLDVDAMNEACRVLIGKQDFSSFQKTGSDNRTTICDLRIAEWKRTERGYRFTIAADRFLRNMVRAITGTCVRIGKGQHPPTHMADVLMAKDRGMAGRSAPARGLYLERIAYPYIT